MTQNVVSAATAKAHWRFWGIGFVVFAALLWLLSPILLPFVMGMALAYFMDPLVDRLERQRCPRWLGAIVALILCAGFFALVIGLLVPLLHTQLSALVAALPTYTEKVKTNLLPWLQNYAAQLPPEQIDQIKQSVSGYAGEAVSMVGGLMKNLLSGGMAVFDIITLLVITPIVAFYLLRDWDALIAVLNKAIPAKHAPVVQAELAKIDETLSGFIRGQALVCLCLGAYYALALYLVGLDFGVTIGLVAGILSFIPYVGTIVGFIGSTGLALMQFESATPILLVVVIYVIGQAVEGNYLAPKLVGERVGLHPVWVIFALMAGGSLFGFLGVMVALPVAAVIGVLVRFAHGQYLQSKYYAE